MALYMVERDLSAVSPQNIQSAQNKLVQLTKQYTANGKPVRYINSMPVADQPRRSIWLFEAANEQLVKEVNECAHLPYNRIVEAMSTIHALI